MTESGSRIRKQVYELTAKDFLDYRIWEFCSDEEEVEGQDEATVRPTDKTELTDELSGACVVAANVRFADGSLGTGYLYNCEDNNIGCVQPNLLTETGQINFWLGGLLFVANAAEKVQLGYGRIGKTKDAAFPLSFESTANVNGRALRVVVDGFMARGLDGKTVIVG
jgi:hypothetical protein